MGNQSCSKNKHFHLFLILVFFNVKLKLLLNFNFSQFHKHIFRSSRTDVFFKIRALKNFAILKIKKRLQQRSFPVRSSHQEVFLKSDVLFLQANVNIDRFPSQNAGIVILCHRSIFIFIEQRFFISQHILVRSVKIIVSNYNRRNWSNLVS